MAFCKSYWFSLSCCNTLDTVKFCDLAHRKLVAFAVQFATIASDMKLIVGLGNPGEKYEGTRHNLGFLVVERFFKDTQPLKATVWDENKKLKSQIAKITVGEEQVILAKPVTFMNNSGMAVNLLAQFYKIKPDDIWIVYDEMDLPLGTMKIRLGGAAGGHHGVESILQSLGTDTFWRFRLGIGVNPVVHHNGEGERLHAPVGKRKMNNGANFVLGTFSQKEASEIKKMIKNASQALQHALEKDLKSAQNQFNTK